MTQSRIKRTVSLGKTIQRGSIRVTPYNRAWIQMENYGGWVSNRPSHLRVEKEGKVRQLPIVDLTRLLQILFFSCSLFFLLVSLFSFLMRRNNHE